MNAPSIKSNGVGPFWLHPKIRAILTRFSAKFFSEASWEKHDEGYALRSPARHICDLRFLQAMLRDATVKTQTWRVLACVALALLFFVFVRLFGWIGWYWPSTT